VGGDESSGDGSDGGCNLEEHSDAHVAEALADVSGGSSGGGSNDRDKRGSDGVTHIDMKGEREERDDDDTAAETGEGAEKSGDKGADQNQRSEEQDGHQELVDSEITERAREFVVLALGRPILD